MFKKLYFRQYFWDMVALWPLVLSPSGNMDQSLPSNTFSVFYAKRLFKSLLFIYMKCMYTYIHFIYIKYLYNKIFNESYKQGWGKKNKKEIITA